MKTRCTCPDAYSFGHEPGCPELAEIVAHREASEIDQQTYPQRYVDALNKEIATLRDALEAQKRLNADAALAFLEETEALRETCGSAVLAQHAAIERAEKAEAQFRKAAEWNKLMELELLNLRSVQSEDKEDAKRAREGETPEQRSRFISESIGGFE